MVSIVLASHGDLAEGLKMTGSMVFGDQPNVATVSLMPSMGPDDFRQKVEEAVASFDDPEDVLFLVDLWGGTPFNQISGLFDAHPSWAILTGVNLPMLVEVYTARFDASKTAHDIAKHVIPRPAPVFASSPSLSSLWRPSPRLPRPRPPIRAPFPRARSSATATSSSCSPVSIPDCSTVRWQPRGPR